MFILILNICNILILNFCSITLFIQYLKYKKRSLILSSLIFHNLYLSSVFHFFNKNLGHLTGTFFDFLINGCLIFSFLDFVTMILFRFLIALIVNESILMFESRIFFLLFFTLEILPINIPVRDFRIIDPEFHFLMVIWFLVVVINTTLKLKAISVDLFAFFQSYLLFFILYFMVEMFNLINENYLFNNELVIFHGKVYVTELSDSILAFTGFHLVVRSLLRQKRDRQPLSKPMDINRYQLLAFCSIFNLTNRECDVVQQIILGLSNAQIGDKLFISEGTVKTHSHNIFMKTKVHNRLQLSNKYHSWCAASINNRGNNNLGAESKIHN